MRVRLNAFVMRGVRAAVRVLNGGASIAYKRQRMMRRPPWQQRNACCPPPPQQEGGAASGGLHLPRRHFRTPNAAAEISGTDFQ